MVAGTFNSVDGSGFQLNRDLVVGNVTGSDYSGAADQILLWNASDSSYTYYYYYDDGTEAGWSNVVGDEYFEDENPDGLPAGSAFWYLAKDNDSTLTTTFSGAVENDEDVTINLTGGNFNMVASAYPTSLQLNDNTQVEWTNVTGSDYSGAADQILLWNAADSSYTYYYYYDDGTEAGWSNVVGDEYFEDENPNGLPAGTPFWYLAKDGTGKAVTFKKNF